EDQSLPGPADCCRVQDFSVTRPERFELPTFGSVDRRSIQLSYGRSRVQRTPTIVASPRPWAAPPGRRTLGADRAGGRADGLGQPLDQRAGGAELGADPFVACGLVEPRLQRVTAADGQLAPAQVLDAPVVDRVAARGTLHRRLGRQHAGAPGRAQAADE